MIEEGVYMAIPDFQSIMLPLLKIASDKKEHTKWEAVEELSKFFELTEEDTEKPLRSGGGTIFADRVGWAKTYLKKAGLLDSKRRGYFYITDRGISVLNQNPSKINTAFLLQYPEFAQYRRRRVRPQQ